MKYAIVSNPRDLISTEGMPGGSVAIVSLNLAGQLAQRHDVTVVVARGAGQPEEQRISPTLRILRIRRQRARLQKIRELSATAFESVPPYFLSTRYQKDFFAQAAAALREFDPAVIHIQNYGQAANVFRKNFPKARIVVQLHDTSIAQVSAAIARPILAGADLIATCSDHVRRAVACAHPWIKAPIVAINNGVDVSGFQPPGLARSDDAVRIVYVGRLSPEKGVHVLIEAFNRVAERVPQARLQLIGAPSMFSYAVVKLFKRDPHWAAIFPFYGNNGVQRLFRQLHQPGQRYVRTLKSMQTARAANATEFLGEQSHEHVARLLIDVDIAVVPSVCDEPFGIPAVEAMAAGIPVVASAAGGLCDIIEDGKTGLMVPRSDAPALADALMTLIANPPQRQSFGKAGRLAASQFTWERAAQNLSQALEQTLA